MLPGAYAGRCPGHKSRWLALRTWPMRHVAGVQRDAPPPPDERMRTTAKTCQKKKKPPADNAEALTMGPAAHSGPWREGGTGGVVWWQGH